MKIVCAPDSFKESMTAAQAAAAMAEGAARVLPDAQIDQVPMSDGGEGFLDSLAAALGASVREVEVADALGRPISAHFALAGDLGVIEAAQANGLEHIDPSDRDIWAASSTGVGQLILAAVDAGARRMVVGIGGSATNDGGAGMLAALGARYLDDQGAALTPCPRELTRVASVDLTGLDARLADVVIETACDVDNPLTGPRGASAVFGPQKGASPDDVNQLDALLATLAALDASAQLSKVPGAGAAGGLGHALRAHLGARLRSGIDLVIDTVGLASRVKDADLVLTGEGCVDAQTLAGKTPAGVARVAQEAGVPVVILAGRVGSDADALLDAGVLALMPIGQEPTDLATALEQGAANMTRATATVLRLFAH